MKTTRTIAIGVIAASLSLFVAEYSAQAKSLSDAEIPAEFPPASFKGKQYVDSRGCVYIRAGIDGLVNWVPRVSRDRKVLCGYQPTFAKAAPAPAPAAKPAANVEVITPAATPKPAPEVKPTVKPKAKPDSIKTAPAAKPAPKKVMTVKTKPVRKAPVAAAPRKVAKAAPKPVMRKPAPVAPAVVAAKPAATTVKPRTGIPAPVAQGTVCAGATGISRRYSAQTREGMPVRCGPQAQPYVNVVRREPVTVMRGGKKVTVQQRVIRRQPTATTPRVAKSGAQTRIVPRHVWEQQQAAKIDAPIPEGYRAAWSDDRLNKKRAHQTVDGVNATDLAWTRTVPRKLYRKSTGLVVTHKYPGLVYPYHSYEEMRAAGLDTVTGVEPQRGIFKTRRKAAPVALTTRTVQPRPQQPAATKTRTQPKAASKGRYVQLGTYSVPANAEKAAARARAKGLPVRLGTLTKGGKSYRIVLAGPYAPNQTAAALGQARRAGYGDAFLR